MSYIPDEYAQRAIDAINSRAPVVFVSGKAGSGKSTLIRHLASTLNREFVLLASTGMAALNVSAGCGVGCQTIHSFFKFPPRMLSPNEIRPLRADIAKKLDLIIFDEVSMTRCDVWDSINICLQKTYKNKKPMGGIQIIMVGDLLQLSPIVSESEKKFFYERYDSPWFFDGEVFGTIPSIECIELKKIYRQNDLKFVKALNNIRSGKNLTNTLIWINKKCFKPDDREMITLATTNKVVDAINIEGLRTLKTPEVTYEAIKGGKLSPDGFPSPEFLVLKPGAKVMITKNNTGIGVVNGQCGIVDVCGPASVDVIMDDGRTVTVGRDSWESFEYTFNKETKHITAKIVSSFMQIPLKLAYSISVHKCQGLTLDAARVNLGSYMFADALTYVALSRVKSIDNLILTRPITVDDIRIDLRAVEFYKMNFEENE